MDSQILLFLGVSEKSVILNEEIPSSQADTELSVGSIGNHFAISIHLQVPLEKKMLWSWARVEFRNRLLLDIMEKLMKMRGDRQRARVRMSMLFVVLLLWRSPGLSPRVSLSQKFFQEKDRRNRLYLKVLLTPLDLLTVRFQIFKLYH